MKQRLRDAGVLAVLCSLLVSAPASAATTPSLLGSVRNSTALSGTTSVAVSGHYAYSPAYFTGELTAVDLSNPAAPVIAGQSSETPAQQNVMLGADTIEIAGGYAFVVSKNRNASRTNNDAGTGNSLSVFDIHTMPADPILVGQIQDRHRLFGAYGVAVQGTHAYVAAQGCLRGQPCPDPTVGNDLAVVDISNPANPQIVGVVSNPASGPYANALAHADSVAASGNDVYVTASGSASLTVIDVADPTVPAIVGRLRDTRSLAAADDVAVQGTEAYVADQTAPAGAMAVVDVSNPAGPRVAGLVTSPKLGGAYRVRVRGQLAFVAADRAGGITVLDVSNPDHPALASALTDPAHLNHTTGLDAVLGGRYLIASSPSLSSETVGAYPPFPLQPGGPSATGTISVIDTDPARVAVRISSPAPGARYAKGLRLRVRYACLPSGSVGLSACGGPVASGARLDTRALGRHTFTVLARDRLGQAGRSSVTYTVIPDPAIADVRQSAKVWRAHGLRRRGRPPVGTRFAFTVNERVNVVLAFSRVRCTAPHNGKPGRRSCRRTAVGTISLTARPGGNRVRFRGRVNGKLLEPGAYAVVITASAGGRSVRRRLTFTVAA